MSLFRLTGCACLLAASSLAAPPAWAAVIDLTYDTVMDMVRPEARPNVALHHNLQVTVSGGGGLSEQRDRSAQQYSDRHATVQVLNSTGDEPSYASWRVAPDGRLVRVQNDPQSTRTMTVTLTGGNACHLDVVDQLKPGFTEYAFLRISTHTLGYYSSYRVVRTTCAMR
jgi:hypothetical protein